MGMICGSWSSSSSLENKKEGRSLRSVLLYFFDAQDALHIEDFYRSVFAEMYLVRETGVGKEDEYMFDASFLYLDGKF